MLVKILKEIAIAAMYTSIVLLAAHIGVQIACYIW